MNPSSVVVGTSPDRAGLKRQTSRAGFVRKASRAGSKRQTSIKDSKQKEESKDKTKKEISSNKDVTMDESVLFESDEGMHDVEREMTERTETEKGNEHELFVKYCVGRNRVIECDDYDLFVKAIKKMYEKIVRNIGRVQHGPWNYETFENFISQFTEDHCGELEYVMREVRFGQAEMIEYQERVDSSVQRQR